MTDELKRFDTEEEELTADDEIITLANEDGDLVNFYHSATLMHNDKWYVVLQPAEELADIEEDAVVIFGLEVGKDGEDVFSPVLDEKLLDEVFQKYLEIAEGDCCCDEEDCPGCQGCEHSHD